MRACAHCGSKFKPKYPASTQRFCSRDCVRNATKAGSIERHTRWDDFEIGELQALNHLSAREAGRVLDRSMQSVQHMRNKLRDGWAPEKLPWTEDEIDFVRRTPDFTANQVAEHLNRGPNGVSRIRGMLSRSEGLDFTRGDQKSPWSVGSRRLLAKTCLGCGLLLDASWYGKAKGRTWRTRCGRCIQRSAITGEKYNQLSGSQKDGGASARKSAQKLQAITREHAVRHGYQWIESDHEILRDSTLTVFEKAIKLGRTWAATHAAVKTNGYTSRVGKGDPMEGVWHIDNPNEQKAVKAA